MNPVVPPQQQPPAAQAAYYNYTAPARYNDVHKPQGSGKWSTSMLKAPCAAPGFCCAAFWCPCCCTYLQRRRLLENDWKRYQCCAGLCGSCCCLGSNCGPCARCCMVLETCFCLSCAVHGNRYMVMQRYGLKLECCDVCIMWCACVLSCLAFICGNDWIQSISDCIYYVVISCLLTQHHVQMDHQFSHPPGNARMG